MFFLTLCSTENKINIFLAYWCSLQKHGTLEHDICRVVKDERLEGLCCNVKDAKG